MVSAKLDLIMKKLDIEKKEVMHINDSHMTCVDTIFGHVSRMAGQGGSTMRVAGKDGCR